MEGEGENLPLPKAVEQMLMEYQILFLTHVKYWELNN
jgi:hypothetical protein